MSAHYRVFSQFGLPDQREHIVTTDRREAIDAAFEVAISGIHAVVVAEASDLGDCLVDDHATALALCEAEEYLGHRLDSEAFSLLAIDQLKERFGDAAILPRHARAGLARNGD